MFSPGTMFRAAVTNTRSNAGRHALNARVCCPVPRSQAGCFFSPTFIEGRRFISAYGYTQAKALVYSKYGEPKDVLQYVIENRLCLHLLRSYADKISPLGYISIQFLLPMELTSSSAFLLRR